MIKANFDFLGQLFVFGFEGKTLPYDFKRFLKDKDLGGVILFSKNIETLAQTKELCSEIKSLSKHSPLVMIDQEGGEVNRITDNFPVFPSNLSYGENEDKKGVAFAYRTTAQNLRKLGINVNLAPVVDVLTNPKNEVIGQRSFGSDPIKVASFSEIAIDAIHSERVLACAKHFPGLGDVDRDPHHELPRNDNSKKRFEKVDFPPFLEAIKSGVKLIMTSHVFCPGLDSEEISTFSPKICSDILRAELNYQGLVITDDMGMGAIVKNHDLNQACWKAFLAGHDLILLCEDFEKQNSLFEYFKKSVVDKRINQTDFSKRIAKIFSDKKSLAGFLE
ncbi:MAG: hypothetical protein AMJ90_03475 [candidate division Zixibacteria bacterium SM23_73_2]|nr:MAG: hypothetical protein AMJ90_03475 [candidate division Zixibacteria bacterium SM23_73_2]